MKKKTFIKAIEALQDQQGRDNHTAELLNKVYPDAFAGNLLPDNHVLTNMIRQMLEEEFLDTYVYIAGMSWIEWFCFECDYGNKQATVRHKDKDGFPTIFQIHNAEELYDYLISISR